ncbi:beta-ketoacyl-[acyl-carrier-protein] synthase family protein [Crossiella sp. CA198]|uniref:beta-ketoacyl-[acyl-carrier-protein] synthase family protein n=1 Tax=Crossiella sp. CA198 TaxID=3455607 RepID=UPI003F8D3B70
MTEVVITGLGALSPLGGTTADTWSALLAGRSGVETLTEDWARELPARLAARMAVDPAGRLDRVQARRLDRSAQAALVAAREAWADAGLEKGAVDPNRVAVVLGTGIGGVGTLLDNYDALLGRGYRRVSPRMVQMIMPNSAAATVSIDLDARAGAICPASACATGAEALAHALDLIRLGRADIVITGGTEACVRSVTMAGFAQAQAMSTRNDEPHRASRPYDKGRDGFVLGEGAAVLIIERADLAAARGRTPYATFAGASITSDAYDMVGLHPQGDGQIRAMTTALKEASLSAADIQHVNAHSTGTPGGDMLEAKAIYDVFGHQPLVSATKSMTGHLLGAAGALEAVFTVLAIHHDVAPPTRNLENPEDDLQIQVTRDTPVNLPINAALSNSFGFGGHNTALVFKKA